MGRPGGARGTEIVVCARPGENEGTKQLPFAQDWLSALHGGHRGVPQRTVVRCLGGENVVIPPATPAACGCGSWPPDRLVRRRRSPCERS